MVVACDFEQNAEILDMFLTGEIDSVEDLQTDEDSSGADSSDADSSSDSDEEDDSSSRSTYRSSSSD